MAPLSQASDDKLTPRRRPVLWRIDWDSVAETLRMQFRAALDAGFEGVELAVDELTGRGLDVPAEFVPRSCPDAATEPRAVEAIAARCATTDIEVATAQVTAGLQHAASLGAHCLNLTIPPVRHLPDGCHFTRYQDALNFAYDLLRRLRYEAEATGVALALEPGIGDALLSPTELRDLIDAASSWAVGVCVDVAHVARIGLPSDWLLTLGRRVHAVRLRDVHRIAGPKTPGADDGVDLQELASVLDQIGYDRPVVVTGLGEPGAVRASLARSLRSNRDAPPFIPHPSASPHDQKPAAGS